MISRFDGTRQGLDRVVRAAFAAAAVDFVRQTPPDGAIILAITGDEEGDAEHGTVALLDWMAAEGERMTHCLVGEPTCPNEMGEMMKFAGLRHKYWPETRTDRAFLAQSSSTFISVSPVSFIFNQRLIYSARP